MRMQMKWMFVDVRRCRACTDVMGDSRKELIENAMKKYGKSAAEIRAWARNRENPTEPMRVRFFGEPTVAQVKAHN